MSSHRILRASKIVRTARVKQLEGMFDLPPSKRSEIAWTVDLPLDKQSWQIGLIYGPSGCGKSTIARELFGPQLISGFNWRPDACVVDDFPEGMSIKEITGLLSSVGFSSPPAWLRPFTALSNGEQFRVTLARALAESPQLSVIDEFTSVVDRTVARIGSAAVAKAIRSRPGTRFVAVACHDDIIDWLQPDWTYQPHTGEFHWRCLQRRPAIELTVQRVTHRHWRQFAHHHYLNAGLHTSAECWLATIDGRPAGFVGVLSAASEGKWRESRLVCLPDFQGVGVGNKLSELIGGIYRGNGLRYYSRTGHPAIIRHRYRSQFWRITEKLNCLKSPHGGTMGKYETSRGRLTAGFEYVGPPIPSPIATQLRALDFSDVLRKSPNRTAARYCDLLNITPSMFATWIRDQMQRGRVIRAGSGRATDPHTFRLADG